MLLSFEVRAKLILIEIVAIAADLFGVIVVPRFDGDVGVLTIGDRLHVGHFFVNARNGPARRASSGPARDRRKRHRVGHAQMSVGREAEDLGAFGAKAQDVGDDPVGVVASPLSPRFWNAVQTRWRNGRFDENCRNGSTLDRVFTIAHCLWCPRSAAAARVVERCSAAGPRGRGGW